MKGDFLPVENVSLKGDLAKQDRAASIGVSPVGRAAMVNRVVLRPGISLDRLPTNGKRSGATVWPQVVCRAHGSFIYRFEDHRVDWISGAHRVISGAPTAYHPFDQNALGSIIEQRARGFPGLVKNEVGELIRQGAGDPVPGHLVSRTAYRHADFPEADPRRYLDAQEIPYVSVPLEMMLSWRDTLPLVLGCAAVVWDRDRNYRFDAVVGEVDLHGIGGVSKYLWDRLAMGAHQSHAGRMQFVLFPGHAAEGYTLQRWTP